MKRIYKLDFGYLVDIKKKILYQNIPSRLIRNKNRKMLKFRKTYRAFSSKYSQSRAFYFIKKLNLKSLLGKMLLKRVRPTYLRLKIKFTRDQNSLGGSHLSKIIIKKNIIKFAAKNFFLKKKTFSLIRKYLAENFKRIKFAIKEIIENKKKKGYKVITDHMGYFKKKRFKKALTKKMQRICAYLRKTKQRKSLLKSLINSPKQTVKLSLKRTILFNYKIISGFSNKINNKSKFNFKKISIFLIKFRKLKIKYYIMKNNMVSMKYIKNLDIKSKLHLENNFYNISFSNITKYQNIKNYKILLKFLLNFLFTYLLKFYNIKSFSEKKKKSKDKYKTKSNHFYLNRYKKLGLNYIFETTNSFFFFRFMKISRKILNLFNPIRNYIQSKLNIKKSNSYISIYHSLLIFDPNKSTSVSCILYENLNDVLKNRGLFAKSLFLITLMGSMNITNINKFKGL